MFSKDFVHLKEESTAPRAETELAKIKRVVWGMLYGVDARVVSRSPQGLAKITPITVQVCSAFGLIAI